MAYFPEDPDLFPVSPRRSQPSRKPPVSRKDAPAKKKPQGKPKRRGGKRPRKGKRVPLWAWVLVILAWVAAMAGVVYVWQQVQAGRFLTAPAPPAMGTETPTVASGVPATSPAPTEEREAVVTSAASPSPTSAITWTPTSPSATAEAPPASPETTTPVATPKPVTPTATPSPLPSPTPTWTPSPEPSPEPTEEGETTPPPGDGEAGLPPETDMALLVPLFVEPALKPQMWDAVAAARQQVEVVAVIYPQGGPGAAVATEYRERVQALRDAGVVVLGYVPTDQGRRSSEAIRSDINLYDAFYPVQGVFLGQMPGDGESLGRFSALYQYARAFFPQGLIFFHFTEMPDATYFSVEGASFVVFDGAFADWETFTMPEGINREVVGLWVHSVPDAVAMRSVVNQVREGDWARYLYLTHDTPPDPWDELPVFWEALVNILAP